MSIFECGDRVRYTPPPGHNTALPAGLTGVVTQVLDNGALIAVRFAGHVWTWALPAGHLDHLHVVALEVHRAVTAERDQIKQELDELKRALRVLSE